MGQPLSPQNSASALGDEQEWTLLPIGVRSKIGHEIVLAESRRMFDCFGAEMHAREISRC